MSNTFLSRFACFVVAGRSAAAFGVAVALTLGTGVASAQTVIYDGSQPLNFFGNSRLNDTLMLNNNAGDPTRNGIVQSGADPNVLEQGDAAWFRSTGRRMNNVGAGTTGGGLAGMAAGVDGDFMTSNWGAGVIDPRGAGAAYVLFDDKSTTGLQTLDFDFFYNDATLNSESTNTVDDVPGNNNHTGGNIAVRVFGIQGTGDAADPWANDDFQLLAGDANAGATVSSGQYRDMDSGGAEPVVDQLLLKESQFDLENPDADIFLPGTDWQSDSLMFDLGSGYDYVFIAFGGVEQDNTNVAGDRYGFDNISFGPAPLPDGDYNGDGQVDAADYTVWRDGGSPDSSQAGYDLWATNYGTGVASQATSIPEPATALLGALAFAGCVAPMRRR